MGWNEPDKNKTPWDGKKKQPPDIDEALKRLQEKIKGLFLGGSSSSKPKGRSSSSSNSKGGGGGILLSLMGLVVLVLWVLSGFFVVDPAEQAVILRFGKYVETVGPGPHWIPRLISSKVIKNVEKVMDYSYAAQMLTQDESLVSVSLIVQYRIGVLEDYLFNVTNPQKSFEQATSSALRQVVGTTTFDQIITEGREALGNNIQETLTRILDKYKTGIVIISVSPQPKAPESVQDAFDDAIKAREDEKRFKEQALAYQARVIPIAQGNAKRIIEEAQAFAQKVMLNAKGEVAEFLSLLPQYEVSSRVTTQRMYLESIKQVLERSTKVIIDNKGGNLLYLPLDKLIAQGLTPEKALALNKNKVNVAKEEREADFKTGRTAIRKTYEQERTSE